MTAEADAHNAALLPLLRLIVDHADTEELQWVILESLCLAVGRLHGRSPRDDKHPIEPKLLYQMEQSQ